MKRLICWKEKDEAGIRHEIRVTFEGKGKIKWQFKRSDRQVWDYDRLPSGRDWEDLLIRTEQRYRRRGVPVEQLECVRSAAQRSRDLSPEVRPHCA